MDKPLPDLPLSKSLRGTKHVQPSVNWATLSVDARAHLRKFILHALEEVRDAVPDDEREEWAGAIEHALTELGERMLLGGWLVGVRRTRIRRIQERMEHSHDATALRKDEAGSTKGKAAQNQDDQGNSTSSHCKGTRVIEPTLRERLRSLRERAQQTAPPTPRPTAKHLLLTVSPPGTIPVIHEADADEYEFPSVQSACMFTPGIFTLPQSEDAEEDDHGAILYGLDSWNPRPWMDEIPLRVVGGTFSFRGVTTQDQHQKLTGVLRLATYMYLSTLLEQSLLIDAHVPLRFPKPSLSSASPANGPRSGASISRALSTGHVNRKHEPPASLWAFFSRKKDNLLHRAVPVRRGSLELPLARKPTLPHSRPPTVRTSEDTSAFPRSRRFSFISDYRPSFMQLPPSKDLEHVERPFTAALARIEKSRNLLSTSAGVVFDPPDLLARLAAREKRNPDLRLGGDEKAALMSLLGWEGKHSLGAGMADMAGFVRHQSFSVLYSEYIPQLSTPSDTRPDTPTSATSTQGSSSTLSIPTPAKYILCGQRRRWITYRYYSKEGGADECLGETVTRQCTQADEPCDDHACHYKKGEHEVRLAHGGVRILIHFGRSAPPEEKLDGDEDLPEMWESCGICGKQSSRGRMQDGTYLLSFAKFLELLVYSTNMVTLSPELCEHTTPPSRPWPAADSPLPRSRLNIVRHFETKGRTVSYSLAGIEDIFEVRVPRLQLLRVRNGDTEHTSEGRQALDIDRRMLRREIMQFWQGLSEHMDTLEGNFMDEHPSTFHKSLPRLPSADTAYNDYEEDGLITPKGQPSKLPPLPPNTPQTPLGTASSRAFPFPSIVARSDSNRSEVRAPTPDPAPPMAATPPATSSSTSSLVLLTHLRHTFQRTEQGLYSELSHTVDSNLNDVRRSFVSAARGATKRLSAWEAKHAAGNPPTLPEAMAPSEPEWWASGCHAVPGGNVIVREDDWGSIIAFTLSSMDYNKELANITTSRSVSASAPVVPPPSPDITRPSFFSRTSTRSWFGPSDPEPDPDQDDVCWHEPETYSAVISRKEHPRDPTSILKLGIPEVLRNKLPDGNSLPLGIKSAGGSGLSVGTRAKADVQVSRQAADGLVSAGSTDRIDKMLQELEAASEPSTVRSSISSSASDKRTSTSSAFVETNIRRGKASSVISAESTSTVGEQQTSPVLPTPPPKDREPTTTSAPSSWSLDSPEAVSMTSALSNTLTSALRYMLRPGSAPPVPAKHHHALLSPGAGASPAIDERPHIKYDWTIGKRLKFSCTVYYAKQFDALRRRCGIDDAFLHSLSRSQNWLAEGGKSKSNFWKTTDEQFIIKTLVNAWNVADLHVLIELGPSYFRYMDATASRPTVLAKLLGFYTVEIRNLETGATQAKADLLIMENLFYQQEVVKTFDLKGIQGRKVKASSTGGSKTLFDGDWIEGQQRALTLVRPYSKVVLQEAIRADCDFLAKSNIMDYSLLVGIDESRKQIACGLVDTIGSYTFAKTLEYKAKQNLHAGKEVTVIPPHEYEERFVHAMDNYFVACPDKWSRPLDDTKIPGDYRQLPSVL